MLLFLRNVPHSTLPALVLLFTLSSVNIPLKASKTERLCGIYLTAEDYIAGKLSYSADANEKGPQLECFSQRLGRPVLFHSGKQTRTFLAGEIWGFRNEEGNTYRYYSGEYVKVIEKEGMMIYVHHSQVIEANQPQFVIGVPAMVNLGNVNGVTYGLIFADKVSDQSYYYFSLGADEALFPLKKDVLKEQFSSNGAFVNSLEEMNGLQCLTDYRKKWGMTRVNYLLKNAGI